jgi:predicted lipid-binding transport protein (Tim44 family)
MERERRFSAHPAAAAAFAAAAVLAAAPDAYARAGGGSNGGGGGILYLILLPIFIAYAWYVNKRIRDKSLKASALIAKLAVRDPEWSEAHLATVVKNAFFAIQKAWCDQDMAALKNLLTPELCAAWSREIEKLHSQGRRNVLDRLTFDSARIDEVENYRDDEKDRFTVCIDAHAADYTVDSSGRIVESNSFSEQKRQKLEPSFEHFREFWTFRRHDRKRWLLERVDESGDWKRSVDAPLVDEDGDAPPS